MHAHGLTEAGRKRLQDHYPQGIVWEYDVDKPFKLQARARAAQYGR